MKFLIWGVVLALVLLWLLRPKAQRAPQRKQPATATAAAPEAMLQCAECGTHFPASEALAAPGGQAFCCEEHRRRHAPR